MDRRDITKPEDETLAVASLLSLDTNTLLSVTGPDAATRAAWRMRAALLQVGEIPTSFPIQRLPQARHPWLPMGSSIPVAFGEISKHWHCAGPVYGERTGRPLLLRTSAQRCHPPAARRGRQPVGRREPKAYHLVAYRPGPKGSLHGGHPRIPQRPKDRRPSGRRPVLLPDCRIPARLARYSGLCRGIPTFGRRLGVLRQHRQWQRQCTNAPHPMRLHWLWRRGSGASFQSRKRSREDGRGA